MNRKYVSFLIFTLLLLSMSPIPVIGDAGPHDDSSGFDIYDYLLMILFVSIIVFSAILGLRKFETIPGTFPIKKMAIAAAITIILNALLLGYIYRDVLL